MTILDVIPTSAWCSTCRAEVGRPCVTPDGRPRAPHTPRLRRALQPPDETLPWQLQ